MATVGGNEKVEMARSDGLFQGGILPVPHHRVNGCSSTQRSSTNFASAQELILRDREQTSTREPYDVVKEDHCENRISNNCNATKKRESLQPLHIPSVTSSSGGDSVSENFFTDPRVNGYGGNLTPELNEFLPSEISVPLENENSNEGHSRTLPSQSSQISFTDTLEVGDREYSMNNTTILEEELFSPEDYSDYSHQQKTAVSDDELYVPDDNGTDLGCMPGDMNMSNATFNIEKSEVQFGPKYNIALPTGMAKVAPGVSVSPTRSASDPNVQKSNHNVGDTSSPAVHISINTPPVQQMPPHYSVTKTESAPVGSPTFVSSMDLKDNPRLPVLQPSVTNTRIGNMTLPATPSSPAPSNMSIINGSVVVGTQIIFNPQHQRDDVAAVNQEKVLQEVQDKLVRNYKHQTKTSFLPWLKGRQVIPMTEFYTESRILAVDKQGKQTRQTVDLIQTLVQEDETRFLVEGEPGMGKTLLAHKLAIDWANKESLQEFKFVFLIFLRDFKDSLEVHVKEELLPSLADEKFKKLWEYCKNNEEQVLFILDGYDELEKCDETKIQKLIERREFQNSKVVVTSRPDVLRTSAQKIIVKGFSEAQMFEFIGKYFKLVNEDSFGRNMKRIIEKDYKYRKLAKRPLFCVLLCMLYGSDVVSKLPEKLSDLMFKIMLCLIKWNNKRVGNVDENTDAFPPEYEELFFNFGKLCLQALKTDKTRFSEKEILEMQVRGMFDSKLLLDLGFLSNDSENDILGPKKFWKPVHKIFLEYLAGLYIANHISRDCRDCRECREFSYIYRHEHVLQFVVGTLDKRAHLALDGRKHHIFLHMKDTELLMLLREAGPTKENCRAVAKLLDHHFATVYTSEVDFEGWSSIIAQNFKKLKSLEIVWRIKSNNPDQESSFTEASPELYTAFFSALKSNTSINKITIRANQDGEPFSEEKIELFFSNLEKVLPKENLRELEIKELKMPVSSHLRNAVEGATRQLDKKALGDLEILRLDMFMDDEDLYVLCDRLRKCAPNLKELQLTGLVIGSRGFNSLVELLKKSKNLQTLYISMDKAHLQPSTGVFLSQRDNHYTPDVMQKHQKQMIRIAVNDSKRVFNERKFSLEAMSTTKDFQDLAGAKPNLKVHRNSCMSSVSLEKFDARSNTEYYTQEEIDEEIHQSEETNQAMSTSELLPQAENTNSGVKFLSVNDSSSHQFSASENNVQSRSAISDSVNTDNRHNFSANTHSDHSALPCGAMNENRRPWQEKKFSTTVKDPTKELSYLFQDPFNLGIKHTYKVNRYTFIPGDGENHIPLPLCNDREHKSVFHDLFHALPESNVRSLTLDYPCLYLSTLDLVCLGDAIRKTKHLETLKLHNLKVAKKYIPVVLGLGQSQSLVTVLLESKSVIIKDAAFFIACTALRHNTTLKSLSLANWEFNIQDKAMATRYFRDLLNNWKVTDLNLANCHIGVGTSIRSTLLTPPIFVPLHGPTRNWSCIKTLRLPGVKLNEQLGMESRGHLLLPILRNCPNLTILDLSASLNHRTQLDDNDSKKFFQLLGSSFRKLKELTLCNWEFKFKNYEETCSEVGVLVRSCTELRVLVLDQVSEVRSGLSIRTPCRATFLHQLVNNMPRLSELSLCLYHIDTFELNRDTAAHLGACFHDHWNSTNKFKLKFFGLTPAVEAALQESLKKDNFSVTISQGYPLEITVRKRSFLSA